MERELINIWDVIHTKSNITGIVITKHNDYVDIALEGNFQVVSFDEIDYKLGSINSLIKIFPISNLHSYLNSEKEQEQIYFDYKIDPLNEKLGKIPLNILFRRNILEATLHSNSIHPVTFHGRRNVTQKEYKEILEEMNNEN